MAGRHPILRLIRGEVDLLTGEGTVAGRPLRLSEGQRVLLRHLVEAEGTVTRDAIETLLAIPRATRAIDLAIHRLRSRIEVDPKAPQHIISVFGEGYRFEPAPSVPRELLGLPPPRTALLGRQGALSELVTLLDEPGPVLLTGMSGVGKSSLLIATAHATEHPRVVYVDLEPLREDELWAELARSTGAAAFGGEEELAAGVLADLRAHPRTLLVLDGAQRLARTVAAAVGRVSAEAPSTCVLVASTLPLELEGHARSLGPLDAASAKALFLARARALGVEPEEDHLGVLVERLDRLPLAIELGAARTRTLSVETLLTRLDERFRLLVDPRAEVARHRSLHAVLALSWSELRREARDVLARLSAFRGPISDEAATAVLGSEASWLPSLVDASWLVPEGSGVRWLESSRAWASEHGDPEVLRDAAVRHARHHLDLATRLQRAEVLSPAAIDAIAAALPDLWAVLEQARVAPEEAVAMADRLYTWVRVVGRFGPFVVALGRLLDELPTSSERARLLRMRAACLAYVEREGEAWSDLDEAEALDDPRDAVNRRLIRAHLLLRGQRLDEAQATYLEALALDPPPQLRIVAEHGLGIIARRRGDLVEAEERLLRALDGRSELPSFRSNVRITYSVLLHQLGRTNEASDQLRLAVRELEPLRAVRTLAGVAWNLGLILPEGGAPEEALVWLTRAGESWGRLGMQGRTAQCALARAGTLIELGRQEEAEILLEETEEIEARDGLEREQVFSLRVIRTVAACERGNPADLAEARELLTTIARDDDIPDATVLLRRLVDLTSGLPTEPPPDRGKTSTERWLGRLIRQRLARQAATKGSRTR